MSEKLFSTAVSEEKIQQAQKRCHQWIFGSSKIFLNAEDKHLKTKAYSHSYIVQGKVNEHYKNGLKSLSMEEWEEAVNSFTKAINLSPERVDLYAKRAEAFIQLCDFRSAALNLQKACSIGSPMEEYLELLSVVLYLQGQCLYDRECYLEALEYFTRSSELQPLNKHIYMQSITCLAALGRHAECIQLVSKWLEDEQGNPDLYIVRARLYDHLNQATRCHQDVQGALALNPKHPVAITMQGKLLARAEDAKRKAVNHAVQGEFQDALKRICSAIDYNPSSAEYYVFRGTMYRKLNEFSAAVDDLVTAMNLCHLQDPMEIQLQAEATEQLHLAYNDFAVHCYVKGFYQEALLLLNKALKGETSKKELYVNRGDCFFKLGELSCALADYQQALEFEHTDWGTLTRIAKLLNEMGVKAQTSRDLGVLVDNKLKGSKQCQAATARASMPLLPQLYVQRAKVRQCLQKTEDAQIDAVISIFLHPSSDEAIPTMIKFFPGKTLEDILNSKLANAAHCALEKSLRDLPRDWREKVQSFGKIVVEATGTKDSRAKGDIGTCVSDQQLVKELIKTRRE
ncbi:hypothetical protein GDO86_015171, partial [Hymenochirus boettgeri]